jgi:putative FmdB family regulatory protein
VPIYEYRCPNGHVFELFQKMGDAPPAGCEVCGEGPVERVLYPVAVHFKGSGFYSTDYGRGSRKKDGAAKDGGGDGDSSSKSETKSEPAKTESKAAEA